MELLFTYGSLQREEVQLGLFKRKLTGLDDQLVGYRISKEKKYGQYPWAYKTDIVSDRIEGVVFEVSKSELLLADAYEGKSYQRTKATLASGKPAWFYIGI